MDGYRPKPGDRSSPDRPPTGGSAVQISQIEYLQRLVVRLSDALTDEGGDWSTDGLDMLRREVANAVPRENLPDWLLKYRTKPELRVVKGE